MRIHQANYYSHNIKHRLSNANEKLLVVQIQIQVLPPYSLIRNTLFVASQFYFTTNVKNNNLCIQVVHTWCPFYQG